jgi:hypothetical protein
MNIAPRGSVVHRRSWTRLINDSRYCFTIQTHEHSGVIRIVVTREFCGELGWEVEVVHDIAWFKEGS